MAHAIGASYDKRADDEIGYNFFDRSLPPRSTNSPSSGAASFDDRPLLWRIAKWALRLLALQCRPHRRQRLRCQWRMRYHEQWMARTPTPKQVVQLMD